MNPRQIVEDAITLLNEKGWCQGTYRGADGARCIRGAVYASTPLEHIASAFHVIHLLNARAGESTLIWNDRSGRTREEVIDLLKDVYAELPL